MRIKTYIHTLINEYIHTYIHTAYSYAYGQPTASYTSVNYAYLHISSVIFPYVRCAGMPFIICTIHICMYVCVCIYVYMDMLLRRLSRPDYCRQMICTGHACVCMVYVFVLVCMFDIVHICTLCCTRMYRCVHTYAHKQKSTTHRTHRTHR